MTRLFQDFDFFSTLDRDQSSLRARDLKKRKNKPVQCNKRVDAFGDVSYDFQYGRNSDSDDSDDPDGEPAFVGQQRPASDDYEVFLFGFFYFFILQDPIIN